MNGSNPQWNSARRFFDRSRRGTSSLIVVLVVLIATSGIMLTVVSSSIRHRMQLRNENQMEQTLWLLDAGVGATVKKMEQLEADADFDDLEIEVDKSLERYRGSIRAETISSDDDQMQVKVTAMLQGLNEHSPITRRSRTLIFDRGKK